MSQLSIEQAFQLALRHHQAGQLLDAEAIYRRLLALQPDHADALHLLGVIAHQMGRHDQAVELISRAISRRSDDAEFHNNLGEALRARNLPGEATAAYRAAIRLRPDFAPAHNNLGVVLREQRQLEEAEIALREAIRLQPAYAAAHYNLAGVLEANGRLPDAIAAYRESLRLHPDFDEAYLNLSFALLASAQPEAAAATLQALLQRRPDHADALNNLGNAFKDMGVLDEAIACFRRATGRAPRHHVAHSNLVYALLYHPGHDARTIHAEHQRWHWQHAAPLAGATRPHANDQSPTRRLRIGYVSPDFRDHVVGLNVLPLLREHAREQFEIFCYSDVQKPDFLTARFREYAGAFRDLVGQSDAQVAETIRADQIDILIDLALHMANHRLLVFARKPAPIQVTFAGYPGTTGLDTIDYRLTDPQLDPPGLFDDCYSETSVRLPETFWCYDPLTTEPAVNPLPALSNGYITFGCLNNFCKVNDPVLRLWARILRAVERSRLLLRAPAGQHRERIRALFADAGLTPDRIEFVAAKPRADYLSLYHQIDLGLDTVPYNGHSTSLDSYWMGVPVVTLVGQTVVGRAGWSQLHNLQLTELAAHSAEEFVQIATTLARDRSRLAGLRAGLRARMSASPLMDAPRFARNIEAAYREMWRRWCHRPNYPPP